MKRKEYFSHPTITAAQKRHFIFLDILPLVGSLISLVVLAQTGVTLLDLGVFLVAFFLTVIGIEVGYHRYYSHRSFEAHPILADFLLITGAMGGQGPAIAWVSNHRHHHRYSDKEEDTHSPHTGEGSFLKRFFHAHLFWKFQYRYPNPRYYAPELLDNDHFNRMDRRYLTWVILGLVLPGVLGGVLSGTAQGAWTAFLFAGVFRLSFGQHLTWCINSVCHLLGDRSFQTADRSRNVGWLALVTLGGSWHNNHHAFQASAKNSYEWWQVDPSYGLLRFWERLGWVSRIKIPDPELIQKRRVA